MLPGDHPAKLAGHESYSRAIATVLALFFRFAGEAGLLENGAALSRRVRRIAVAIADNAMDPRHWGPAKTFAMAAVQAGVDVTDAAEMDRFLVVYKKRLARKFERAAPAGRPRLHSGREDPGTH